MKGQDVCCQSSHCIKEVAFMAYCFTVVPKHVTQARTEAGCRGVSERSRALADRNTGGWMQGTLEMFLVKPLLTTVRVPP